MTVFADRQSRPAISLLVSPLANSASDGRARRPVQTPVAAQRDIEDVADGRTDLVALQHGRSVHGERDSRTEILGCEPAQFVIHRRRILLRAAAVAPRGAAMSGPRPNSHTGRSVPGNRYRAPRFSPCSSSTPRSRILWSTWLA